MQRDPPTDKKITGLGNYVKIQSFKGTFGDGRKTSKRKE